MVQGLFPERFGGEDDGIALSEPGVHDLNDKVVGGSLIGADDQGTAAFGGVMEALAEFVYGDFLIPVVKGRDGRGDDAHQLRVFAGFK